MIDKLAQLEQRYEQIQEEMVKEENLTDLAATQRYARELSSLESIVHKYRELKEILKHLNDTEEMLQTERDEDLRTYAKEELETRKKERDEITQEIKLALLPKDERDEKSAFVEIRAGVGGDEAGLFAAELFRMYSRYAESKRWSVDILNSNASGIGGFKEIIFEVKGKGAYSRLKYEGGVHRVQRVPTTESGGRIHTSTAAVLVLPEAEDVEIDIRPEDLRIDVYRSTGHGGQSVNTTDSAVRITHLPTGLVVTCQDEKSQLKNKTKALSVLKARLWDMEHEKRQVEQGEQRRLQVKTADRNEKIRTYNFPQDRLTDHRINLSIHNLPSIMAGNIDELIDALITNDQADQLGGEI